MLKCEMELVLLNSPVGVAHVLHVGRGAVCAGQLAPDAVDLLAEGVAQGLDLGVQQLHGGPQVFGQRLRAACVALSQLSPHGVAHGLDGALGVDGGFHQAPHGRLLQDAEGQGQYVFTARLVLMAASIRLLTADSCKKQRDKVILYV